MKDWSVLVVMEPGGPSATQAGADRFTEELRGRLQRGVELVERALATIEVSPSSLVVVYPRDHDAVLARIRAVGLAGRTVVLGFTRTGAAPLAVEHGLAGALPGTEYAHWQHGVYPHTGRGLWGRLDVARRIGATVYSTEDSGRYGKLELASKTLPDLIAAYLGALAAELPEPPLPPAWRPSPEAIWAEDDPWTLDTMKYDDRGGAVVRGRKLQQDFIDIKVEESKGDWVVSYRDPVPTSTTYPFDDAPTFTSEASAEGRARRLRAYGYVVSVDNRGKDWVCAITRLAGDTGKPRLPTATGPDTGFEYDLEVSAKRRADALTAAGFSVTVQKRGAGVWQVEIDKLPGYRVTGTTTTTAPAATAPPAAATTTTTTTKAPAAPTPPHKLVLISSADPDKHKLSDAVVASFRSFVADVKALTDVDLGASFGDTIRALENPTTKVGADSFSWHKTGRAVDLDQSRRWVIVEETASGETRFRLHLRHKDLTSAAGAGIVTFPTGTKFTSSFWSTVDPTWPFVDVTAIAAKHDWVRIPAQTGWSTTGPDYNKMEWWHYQRTDGLTWFEALAELHTEDEIAAAIGRFADANQHAGRLKREGFSDPMLAKVFPAVKRGKLTLHCPVGSGSRAGNLFVDVTDVQWQLIAAGKLAAGKDSGTFDAATKTAIEQFQHSKGWTPDGLIEVGNRTHEELGKV